MNSRAVAARALLRISDRGAYSNVLLPAITRSLSAPDRAFVYRLVTDALRTSRRVDQVITEASPRGIEGLDPEVLAILRIAVAEIDSGDGDRMYATVNESVEAVKQLGKPRAAGFVNAVLRRMAREGLPDVAGSPAISLAVPDWLYDALCAAHGQAEAGRLLKGLRESPATPLRVRPGGKAPRGVRPVAGIADAYYADGPVASEHGLTHTDPASTAVGLAVSPRPGERVLDMAAAPGGKTLHLWDLASGAAEIVALDRHRRRLASARSRLTGLGAAPLWVNGDGTQAPFGDGVFDGVLVDAPCTGLGTLRRRPEIAMRVTHGAPRRLADQQKELLAEAWRVTRSGGRIIYSVCTFFAEETVDVVADYPGAAPPALPGRKWGKGLLLAPHLTGTDGMFISLIERTGRRAPG